MPAMRYSLTRLIDLSVFLATNEDVRAACADAHVIYLRPA